MFKKLVASLALLAVWPSAAAADLTVVTQTRVTEIAAYGDVAIFSRWNGSDYSLVLTRAGGKPEALPVTPQPGPFDADIGPDAAGRPTAVFSRCAGGSCGLYLLRLDGTPAQRIDTIDLRQAGTAHPTISRDRVAWVDSSGYVLTRRLSAPASTRATVLRRAPTDDGYVGDLELSGDNVALTTVRWPPVGVAIGVCGWHELRLIDVKSRRSRIVGSHLCGSAGQRWVGPTFDGDWLYAARTCNGDGGCSSSRFGVYRYNVRSRKYQLAGDGRPVDGWAYAGSGRAYRVALGQSSCWDLTPCSVVWGSGLRFSPTSAPIATLPSEFRRKSSAKPPRS